MAATNRTHNARKPLRNWRPAFLAELEAEGTVYTACVNAGISRSTAYRERQRNEAFAVAWADVEAIVTDKLERKAVQLALNGEVKMLEFLLKARRPETYRESVRVEHAGRVRHEVKLPTEQEWHADVAKVLVDVGAVQLPDGSGNGSDPH